MELNRAASGGPVTRSWPSGCTCRARSSFTTRRPARSRAGTFWSGSSPLRSDWRVVQSRWKSTWKRSRFYTRHCCCSARRSSRRPSRCYSPCGGSLAAGAEARSLDRRRRLHGPADAGPNIRCGPHTTGAQRPMPDRVTHMTTLWIRCETGGPAMRALREVRRLAGCAAASRLQVSPSFGFASRCGPGGLASRPREGPRVCSDATSDRRSSWRTARRSSRRRRGLVAETEGEISGPLRGDHSMARSTSWRSPRTPGGNAPALAGIWSPKRAPRPASRRLARDRDDRQ